MVKNIGKPKSFIHKIILGIFSLSIIKPHEGVMNIRIPQENVYINPICYSFKLKELR